MLSFDLWMTRFSRHLVGRKPGLSVKSAWAIGLQHYEPASDPVALAERCLGTDNPGHSDGVSASHATVTASRSGRRAAAARAPSAERPVSRASKHR
jgi:hypothetical protein